MGEEHLKEAMSKMMMEFSREGKRRSGIQQAVDRVFERVGYFNGAEAEFF